MTTEQKFRAAVNVIRNLPKHGPVQPSNNVMLKFYAFFKQATEGPNHTPKPPFWDLVRKAKWDAWTKLGNMNPETAMDLYVDEFKKIVESVSASNTNLDKTEVDNFYASVPLKDLELLVGPVVSQPNSVSPLVEAEMNTKDDHVQPEKNENNMESLTNGTDYHSIKSQEEEEDEEYFLDTIENSDNIPRHQINSQLMNGYAFPVVDDFISNNNRRSFKEDQETNLHLTQVITCLQRDLEKVVNSVSIIEQRIGQLQGKMLTKNSRRSSLWRSPMLTLAMLIAWPVLLQLFMYWIRRRNR